ncbi:hypothetical protein DCC39_07475 [Pueribacillus theae]|uniref:Zinc finger CHC2-type domain-containing protein n=1 Tax=Pueribacillus theae TaxID=2171751 RepID=A0A2U1K3J3_9BACI|nr:CHC2 zinc finger domain-containing protein [Pueribacillus theae]PWA12081.1 hypothetical protein DCC39_07475 [Pueribacillus theae]
MGAIDLIKHHVPIMDALDRYAGANFSKAKTNRSRFNIHCPYHADRNPSFTVYTDTNTFRCWSGCNDGKPGDVIDIVRLSYNLDTKEAIQTLMNDYGLKNPNSEQMREWQKKRAEQQELLAISKALDNKVNENIEALRRLETYLKKQLTAIKTIEDMERIGELYHSLQQIEYWLDCLIDPNPITQFGAVKEAEQFLKQWT